MTRDRHAPHEPGHRDHGHPDREREGGARNHGSGSQGIVRDQRGQEQPADKERAQRVSKTR